MVAAHTEGRWVVKGQVPALNLGRVRTASSSQIEKAKRCDKMLDVLLDCHKGYRWKNECGMWFR
jgi:hypothetical protein